MNVPLQVKATLKAIVKLSQLRMCLAENLYIQQAMYLFFINENNSIFYSVSVYVDIPILRNS